MKQLLLMLSAAAALVGQGGMSSPTDPYISISLTGPAGGTAYYYWLVVTYPGGFRVVSPPTARPNAPNTLTGANYLTLNWQSVANATAYDLLRTTTATRPSGSCNCALIIGTAATTFNDTGTSLLSYSAPLSGSVSTICLPGAGGTSNCTLLTWGLATGVFDLRIRRSHTFAVTVANLQPCNAQSAGSVQTVNDALVPVLSSAIAGGGAVVAQVFCNGSTWKVSAL